MKRKLPHWRWLVSIAIAISLIYACRKDRFSPQENKQLTDPNVALSIKGARAYYKQLVISQGDTVKAVSGVKTLSQPAASVPPINRKFPLFSKAYASQTGRASFVEVPLISNHKTSIILNYGRTLTLEQQEEVFKSTFTRLLIYKSKSTGIINQKILTYIPDIDYLETHHNDISNNKIDKLDADFSGCIEYSNWDGTPLSIYVIKQHKIVKRISLRKRGNKTNGTVTTQSINQTIKTNGQYICGTDEIPVWAQTCDVVSTEGIPEATCTDYVDHYEYDFIYCDDGLTGNDCTDYGIGCNEDPTPTPYPTPPGQPGSSPNRFVTTPQTPACLSNILGSVASLASYNTILDQMAQQDNGQSYNPYYDVSGIISGIANSNTWNISIIAANLPQQTDSYGNTFTPNATTRAESGTIIVRVDNNYLNTASSLAVARTVIHETLHGYFEYGLSDPSGNNYSEFQMMNTYLFDRKGRPDDTEDNQHEEIAQRYVTQLGNLVEQYATAHGITSPNSSITLHNYCQDLAWGGLTGTAAYTHYAKNKSRIEAEVMNEQSHNNQSTSPKACN